MNDCSSVKFLSLFAIPSRNGVYVPKEKHGRGIPIINMGELFGNEFITHGTEEKVEINEKERELSLLADGDLLFARRSLVESGAGKCSIVLHPSEELTFESSVIRVRLNSNICNPLFYYYWFKSDLGKRAMRTLVTGSNVKGIKGSELGNLLVPCIPIKEQNIIAEYLFKIELAIENSKEIILELESLAKEIYDYWFVQFDFPDENGKPYKSSGGKMVWNEELKMEIPKGWIVKPSLDIFDWIGTSQPPKSSFVYESKPGYIRFIQNRDYEGDNHLTYIPLTKGTRMCSEFDIMMDKYGDAGKTRYGIEGAYNVALAKIAVHDIWMREYVRAYFSSERIYNYLHSACVASTRASLNESNFIFLSITLPPKIILERFNEIVFNGIKMILTLKKENKELSSLRDWLLPMLMNGQVKIGNNTGDAK